MQLMILHLIAELLCTHQAVTSNSATLTLLRAGASHHTPDTIAASGSDRPSEASSTGGLTDSTTGPTVTAGGWPGRIGRRSRKRGALAHCTA